MDVMEPAQSCPACGGPARVARLHRVPFDHRPENQVFEVECPACRRGAYMLGWDAFRAARGSKDVARRLLGLVRADAEGRFGSVSDPITLDDIPPAKESREAA